MNDNGSGNGSGILAGLVVGALVGAGVALMYAPCSGKDTRQWLSRKSNDLKEKTGTAYEATMDTFRREARNLVGDAKDAVKGRA